MTFWIWAAILILSVNGQGDQGPDPKTGTWSVGDCILAQFNMDFNLVLDKSKPNITTTMTIPTEAKVIKEKSKCDGKEQRLTIGWKDPQKNDTQILLTREITIKFQQNLTQSYYGMLRFYGHFDLARWTVNGTVHNSTVAMDSLDVPKLMFHTPLDRSFTCKDIGNFTLVTTIKFEPDAPPQGTPLPNAVVETTQLKFDAFRVTGQKPPTGFRTPLDCDYQPNDIVPIAVGVALALLVIVVLVAYMVGRRKNRQRGYQSV